MRSMSGSRLFGRGRMCPRKVTGAAGADGKGVPGVVPTTVSGGVRRLTIARARVECPLTVPIRMMSLEAQGIIPCSR